MGKIVAVPKNHDVKTYAKTGGKAPHIPNHGTDGSGDIRYLIALSDMQQSRREKSSPCRESNSVKSTVVNHCNH
jgi:hypothetical protein